MPKKGRNDEDKTEEQPSPFVSDINLQSPGQMNPVKDSDPGAVEPSPQPLLRVGSAAGISTDTRISLSAGDKTEVTVESRSGRFSSLMATVVCQMLLRDERYRMELSRFLQCLSEETAFLVGIQIGDELPSESSIETAIYRSLGDLSAVDWQYVQANYVQHGKWSFCPDPESSQYVELILIPWHRLRVEQLKNRYNLAQENIAKIEAMRTRLIEATVAPLLNEIATELESHTLPEINREELQEMYSELRKEAYYPGIISTSEAAKMLDRSEEIARRHARKGTVGLLNGERNYVFNELDVTAFSKIDRPHGGDQTKKKNR